MDRLYDERKPIEPVYPSVLASKAEKSYTPNSTESQSSVDIEQLIHAPPGYGPSIQARNIALIMILREDRVTLD